MIFKGLSGKAAAVYARRQIQQRGADIVVTRPNPRPATLRTLRCQIQQMSARQAETLRLQGKLNMDAPLPVNFLFLPGADVQTGDELPYNGAVYTLLGPMPQDYNGVTLFIQAKGTIQG